VQRGDTASRIALAHKPDDVSMDQMLLALLHENPDAFINGNVNLLKAGATLKMPGKGQASVIAQREAMRDVAQQNREFDEYRRRIARVVPSVPADVSRLQLPKQNVPAKPPAPPRSRLTLSNRGTVLGERQIARDLMKKAEQTQKVSEEIKALANQAVRAASSTGKSASAAARAAQAPASQPAKPASAPKAARK
jgi:pilus assembly protein FimV